MRSNEKQGISFTEIPLVGIGKDEIVKIKTINNRVEMTKVHGYNYDISQHRKVSGGKTVKILKNGKVTQPVKNKENKYDYRSIVTVRKSFINALNLIELNFKGDPQTEYHVVLKYNKAEFDMNKANRNVSDLMKKLNRLLPDTKIIYISKAELHSAKRGWHAHVMIRFENKSKTLTRKEIDKYMELWKYGSIYISEIYDAEGLAHYLLDMAKPTAAYKDSVANGNSYNNKYKKYKNYEQSLYYPKGCKLYTTSVGLKKPSIVNVEKKEYDRVVAGKQLVCAESKIITNSDGEILSKFTKIIHS